MRTLLSIIWFLFGGVWLWLGYMFFGIIAYIFIVTVPASVASFRIASYVFWPFGKHVVDIPNTDADSTLMNTVWFLIAGLWLTPDYVMMAPAQPITIISIPVVVANTKIVPITCFPFRKMAVMDPKAII